MTEILVPSLRAQNQSSIRDCYLIIAISSSTTRTSTNRNESENPATIHMRRILSIEHICAADETDISPTLSREDQWWISYVLRRESLQYNIKYFTVFSVCLPSIYFSSHSLRIDTNFLYVFFLLSFKRFIIILLWRVFVMLNSLSASVVGCGNYKRLRLTTWPAPNLTATKAAAAATVLSVDYAGQS